MKTFDLEFGGHIMARLVIEDNEPKVIACVTGYGDALDIELITITESEL